MFFSMQVSTGMILATFLFTCRISFTLSQLFVSFTIDIKKNYISSWHKTHVSRFAMRNTFIIYNLQTIRILKSIIKDSNILLRIKLM
jgi:hypothetical protein